MPPNELRSVNCGARIATTRWSARLTSKICSLFGYVTLAAMFLNSGRSVAAAATLAGQQIVPGKAIEIRFPVSQHYQDYAAEGGNPRPTIGRAVWAFPKNFDPARTWPILIVTSTTDGRRRSPDDLPFYQEPATHEGWIALATDATIATRIDSDNWRLSMLAAALDQLHHEWPQSATWPVAFAGASGGAKRSGFMAAMLATTRSLRICGLFLEGMNDDRVSVAYNQFHPPSTFLEVPIWLSSGLNDTIAPPFSQQRVQTSLQHTGFKHVRLEPFDGKHQLKAAELERALRWFRELGKF